MSARGELRPAKAFAIWGAAVIGAFGALAGITSATRGTEQIFVVVDTSFQMRDLVSRVPAELDRIDDRDRAEFALATVARAGDRVHGYQPNLDWVRVDAFGPCSFDDIDAAPEAASADQRILITTSTTECSTEALDGWTIIELDR